MATYNVKFRVRYAGGTGDEWSEALSPDKYNWYCDGGQGERRMKAMAEARDYQGRKVNSITMGLDHIS